MKKLIEKLKAAEQNASGMFEIDEDTICALMAILTAEPVAYYFPGSDIESPQLGFPWELDEEQMANCIELIAR